MNYVSKKKKKGLQQTSLEYDSALGMARHRHSRQLFMNLNNTKVEYYLNYISVEFFTCRISSLKHLSYCLFQHAGTCGEYTREDFI